ncbi:MAG: ammonium transporter [Flavobacteriaceae bacterium]|nr:ammonium transporter [Flavobacteriaceae bacterium]|tara:strand:+ start:1013 stop:2251 length:1239 start_codon:yes stop_codon:yes gene_type:complete
MELLTSNNVWMMICTALVFFMHLGFSFLEIGLTRQKNTINILFKNFFVITMGLLVYCGFGFNIMYPGEFGIIDQVLGFAGPGLDPGDGYDQLTYADGGYTYWTDFLFQGMFAATAATIISGAVAERIKISAFMLIAFLYVSIIYPIVGSWQWGGGFFSTFTEDLGFYDFAGSTLVHSVGGWGALVVIYFLGARKGKFDSDGKPLAITGSNIPLSAAGVLILWLGWFGFNGGSVLSADPALTSLTLVTTCLAAAAGGVSAALTSRIAYNNLDLTMFMNGVLGGLVGITAGADQMLPMSAIIIGTIAGPIVVAGVALLDKCKLDDPVGAIPVHLFCGIWGTLAVGLFGEMAGFDQFMVQLACVGIAGFFCVVGGILITVIVKSITGLRVDEKEEEDGLDIAEHGTRAYGDFSIN